MEVNKLNIRVYALLIHEEKFLVLKETYAGEKLIKLPGGGLEIGESVHQTLIREFKEELNLTVEIGEHIYTQDFFLNSKFIKTEQLLTIYYYAKPLNVNELKIIDSDIDELHWIPLKEIHEDFFPLPVDKVVAKIIREKLKKL
jgi:8-oxo-dGTP diphosphatase